MKRSLAPSVLLKKQEDAVNANEEAGPAPGAGRRGGRFKDDDKNKEYQDVITIERLPLFNFLEIPAYLNKEFKIPTGCVITEKSLELRKTKTLGQRKIFRIIRPGDQLGGLPTSNQLFEGEDVVEQVALSEKLPPFERLVLWSDPNDESNVVEVIPQLASKLRPHQREGVQFLFECTMGLRGFDGEGCILADDMGLGKTFMSITLVWTLLHQGFVKGQSAVTKVVIVCPTSLVGNWENEFRRWIGDHCPTFAVKSEPKKIISSFLMLRGKAILIVSYETQRRYSEMFTSSSKNKLKLSLNSCDLLICDEAHKLKNAESGLAQSLNSLPAKKRILLSGTPMQNELEEFYNMVNFCNPGVLGDLSYFRKHYERPILIAREPHASESTKTKAALLQKELSTIVNEFILKRGNILNAQHLPPKLVQFVCCKLTPMQEHLYDLLLNSKECRQIRDGRQTNTLNSIRHMLNICSHPSLLVSAYEQKKQSKGESEDEALEELAKAVLDCGIHSQNGIQNESRGDRVISRGLKATTAKMKSQFNPEVSGKFLVLYRLMQTLRSLPSKDRIVVISNYTSTLDLVETMCDDNNWPFLRLDGSTTSKKRTQLVDKFNDPFCNCFAFLLSSKAGGCGINLIGGNRLVLFDPDWNPASDKQAAARIWREGQKKRCYIYRFMSTNTIEEKIIQRQLSKEGLQSIVDNKDQVNIFSTNELKALFKRKRNETRCDTHDTLKCKRCSYVSPETSNLDSTAMTREQIDVCLSAVQEMDELIRSHINQTLSGAEGLEQSKEVIASIMELMNEEKKLIKIQKTIGDLLNEKCSITMPQCSKLLRDLFRFYDNELSNILGIEILREYIDRWTSRVSLLTKQVVDSKRKADDKNQLNTSKRHSTDASSEDTESRKDDDSDSDPSEECVGQEGCPEEEDFNRWSHHASVNTCDDEALKIAMSDDDTISFVFGLEVNWTLLQARVAAQAEEEARRKEQQRIDLEELNKTRKQKKENISIESSTGTYTDKSEPHQNKENEENCRAQKPQNSRINKKEASILRKMPNCDQRNSKKIESDFITDEEEACSKEGEAVDDNFSSRGNSSSDEDIEKLGNNSKDAYPHPPISVVAMKVSDSNNSSEAASPIENHTPFTKIKGDKALIRASPKPTDPNKTKAAPDQWSCDACTYLNLDASSNRCEMCSKVRTKKGRLALPPRK